jgi:integrase
VLRRFQKVCEANNLPRLRLYDLRHTHASLRIHEGVHPKRTSERLGHSSIKLTMDTYGHLFEGCDRDSAEKMERLPGDEPNWPRVLTMPSANRPADKNIEARVRRAPK